MVDPATPTDATPAEATARRARFRAAVAALAERSSSADLVRWMLVPGSLAVLAGFVVMTLGWVGAARTAREIEQIPYLISGGLIGLALVVLGGLLLVSTFWVAVLRKLQQEADERAQASVADLTARVVALEGDGDEGRATTPRRRAPARRRAAS